VPRQLIEETMIDQPPVTGQEPGLDRELPVGHEPEFGPDPRVGQPVVEEPTMAGDSVGALVLPMPVAEVAVVTGAGAGLGRAIASGLASAGYGIVAVDVDPDSAAACATQVRAFGVPARAVRADIRDPQYLEQIVAVADELGGAGVLVNSAGDGTLDLTASMLLSQLVLEPMRAHGGGAIVNVVSSPDAGDRLIRFTATLAGPADGYGVRAMCVTADPRRTHPADLVTAVLDLIQRGRAGAVVQMETVGLRPGPP
jgi:NAD(P)-dependent dehydrogenase (short-subunit alcohol dehydrogenase family)